MAMFLRILGVLLEIVAIVWVITIGVAVANHDETANTLIKLIPGLAFHVGAALAGAVCFGVAQRIKSRGQQPVAQRG